MKALIKKIQIYTRNESIDRKRGNIRSADAWKSQARAKVPLLRPYQAVLMKTFK